MTTATPRNVPRLAKFIDLAGLVLLAIGIACYGRAYIGLEALRANGTPLGGVQFAGLLEYERLNQVSRIGLGIAAFAIGQFVVGAIITWRARQVAPVGEPVVVLEG